MKQEIVSFIEASSFPCIMAKAVAKQGLLEVHTVSDLCDPATVKQVLGHLYTFIDEMKKNTKKLASFVLVIKNDSYSEFEKFEEIFWQFLPQLHQEDKLLYSHDPRVSSNPEEQKFGYSLKQEAFFIVALHPQSPRWARRFKHPTIVFNPHQQFENMRQKGIFKRVRNLIRLKDKLLQGTINPMLSDFGEKSEVFQYIGRIYNPTDRVPLNI